MSARSIEELKAELQEAVLQVHNLTALLDESMQAEHEERILEDLQQARALVVRLERELQEAEAAG